jgi:hypothetical protein
MESKKYLKIGACGLTCSMPQPAKICSQKRKSTKQVRSCKASSKKQVWSCKTPTKKQVRSCKARLSKKLKVSRKTSRV